MQLPLLKTNTPMAADAEVRRKKLIRSFLLVVLFSEIATLLFFLSKIATLLVLKAQLHCRESEYHFLKSKPDPPLISVISIDNLTIDPSNPAAGAKFRLTTVVAPKPRDNSTSFTFVKGVSWVTYGNSTNSSTTAFSEKTDLLKLDFSMENIIGADADLLGKEVKERKTISFELTFDLIVSWKKKNDWLSGQFHQVYSCPISLHLDRTGDPRIIHVVKDASLFGSPLSIRRIHGNAVTSNYSTVHGVVKDAFFMVNNVCLDNEWGVY